MPQGGAARTPRESGNPMLRGGAVPFVIPAVSFTQHFCLQHAHEAFPAHDLILNPSVKRLAEGVVPQAAWGDIKRLKFTRSDLFGGTRLR